MLTLFDSDGNLSNVELIKGYLSVFLAHLIFGLLGAHLALIINKFNANGRGVLLGLLLVGIWGLSIFWDMGAGEHFIWLLETALQVTQIGLIGILLVMLWISVARYNSKEYYK